MGQVIGRNALVDELLDAAARLHRAAELLWAGQWQSDVERDVIRTCSALVEKITEGQRS